MRRLLMMALGWLVLAAGVACIVVWVLAIGALVARSLGHPAIISLAGIAEATIWLTVIIFAFIMIDRTSPLLAWLRRIT